MVVRSDGALFVAINAPSNRQPSFGVVGLRDVDGDGKADEQSQFSAGLGGNGLAWWSGHLYLGANDRIVRFRMGTTSLTPTRTPSVVVTGLPADIEHISKSVVVASRGRLFVSIGSRSNSCQEANRQFESPGFFPCTELSQRAGIWLFDSGGANQTLAQGQHFATGLRNVVALARNPADGILYGVQHGRERFSDNWGSIYTTEEDGLLPAEEFVRISEGSDNGWPYCYHDGVFQNRKVLAPEYGGDGQRVSGGPGIDCASYTHPLVAFPAHWAPNGLHFYRGTQFPSRYRRGAFIAFHGSARAWAHGNWGYNVAFVPMKNGRPTGPPEVFADGFLGGGRPGSARHRPSGVTEGPDGSLYISDDRRGRIWRVVYTGG
jgi:glucose/arabinose dehydrogenase